MRYWVRLLISRYSADEFRWAMEVSLLEQWRNEVILEEAMVEPIVMGKRMRRLDWSGHIKRRYETENIKSVVEMKMEEKRPRGRRRLRWDYTIGRDLKAWNIREEWGTDKEKGKYICKTRTTHRETWRKVRMKAVCLPVCSNPSSRP